MSLPKPVPKAKAPKTPKSTPKTPPASADTANGVQTATIDRDQLREMVEEVLTLRARQLDEGNPIASKVESPEPIELAWDAGGKLEDFKANGFGVIYEFPNMGALMIDCDDDLIWVNFEHQWFNVELRESLQIIGALQMAADCSMNGHNILRRMNLIAAKLPAEKEAA